MLKSIEIEGLRSFSSNQKILFALPNGKAGSGITVIVGENNAGKSTVIDVIRIAGMKNPSLEISTTSFNRKTGKKVKIVFETDERSYSFGSAPMGSPGQLELLDYEPSPDVDNKVISILGGNLSYVSPKRGYVSTVSKGSFGKDNLSNSHFSERKREHYGDTNSRVASWNKNSVAIDKITKYLFGKDFKWTFGEDSQRDDYAFNVISGEHEHSVNEAGNGICVLLDIIDSLKNDDYQCIVIDEPELSLSPTMQKKVFKLLKEKSANCQIVYVTHSPHFIDMDIIENGARLNRVCKNYRDGSEVHGIDNNVFEKISKIDSSWRNPHKFGYDAKEIFFVPDNVIVCEGQEDVALFSEYLEGRDELDCDAVFYGWGAGGADNIPKFLNVFNELGYSKVTAIVDGDRSKKYCDDIKSQFPKYNLVCLPTHDVRDKEAVNFEGCEGIFSSKGVIKRVFEDVLVQMFKDIQIYNNKK